MTAQRLLRHFTGADENEVIRHRWSGASGIHEVWPEQLARKSWSAWE